MAGSIEFIMCNFSDEIQGVWKGVAVNLRKKITNDFNISYDEK